MLGGVGVASSYNQQAVFAPGAFSNRRRERRLPLDMMHLPIAVNATHGGTEYRLEILNYHYRGACLKLPADMDAEVFTRGTLPTLDLLLGKKVLKRNFSYRICWTDFELSRTLAVEFQTSIKSLVDRHERIAVNSRHKPTVVAVDPLDPTRKIFFNVENVSKTGMLLSTSLTNRHLLPGMDLKSAEVSFPGSDKAVCTLFIENARKFSEGDEFHLGVSFASATGNFRAAMARYLDLFTSAGESTQLGSGGSRENSRIKDGFTYRQITTQEEYATVLQLRFAGYGAHGKVRPGSGPESQGEGLENEGPIIAALLGGRIVAAAELRFGDRSLPLRTELLVGPSLAEKIEREKTVEVNKLVVHPGAQGTDAVVGLFQKITSIILARGGLDVLLVATDELQKFYVKIGAIELGLKVPHPILPDRLLNVMKIPRETFFGEGQFHPLAFEKLYGAVHEYMAAIGVAPAIKADFSRTLRLKVGKAALQLSRSFLGKAKDQPSSKSAGVDAERVDSRWTKQHYVSTIIWPYILEAEAMIGADEVGRILGKIGVPRRYFEKQSAWVSVAFLDKFCDEFRELGDLMELSRRAGVRGLAKDVAGLNHYLLKFLMQPEFVLKSFSKNASRFNKTRTYRATDLRPGHCNVHIGCNERTLLPKHRESCENWRANLACFIEIMTGKPGDVQKVSCCYDGAEECVYSISWDVKGKRHKRAFLPIFGASAAILAFSLCLASLGFWWSLGLIFGIGLSARSSLLELKVRNLRRDAQGAATEFEEYQAEAEQRYGELETTKDELNRRYIEANLLEETAKRVQSNDGLESILNSSLNAICDSFNFGRAFIMLEDQRTQKLKTAAVAGVETGRDLLWKFSVDISKQRDGALFVSSVFLSGQPAVIEDVNSHLFQLNSSSQKIVEALGVSSFLLIPVPAEGSEDQSGRNWGVLVADRRPGDKRVDRKDLVLLQRLAAHLGLALDKQAKIEREKTIRGIFQKYVPKAVVNDCFRDQRAPSLGGALRDITCMFVDIRGFTAMADRLAPQVTLDVLNKFLSLVCQAAEKHGATVDKFLGDGALLTWGSFGPVDRPEELAVETAKAILMGLEQFNVDLEARGLGRIHIGMGIDTGKAITGNVGSDERMEFTCIGNAVNMASRLENLCKFYSTPLVVSETVAEAIHSNSPASHADWEVFHGVMIRGVDEPRKVVVYRGHQNKRAEILLVQSLKDAA